MRDPRSLRFVSLALLSWGLCGLAAAGGAVCTPADGDDCLERRVSELALELARASVDAPDRFEVDSVRFGGADPVRGSRIELRARDVAGPNASGIVRLGFALVVDGVPRGEARATARGKVRGPAATAIRTVVAGQPIPPDAVEVVDADLTRLTAPPVRGAGGTAGLVPSRTLGAGRVITTDLLSPTPVVRRGETVELRIERAGLRITARGIARRDGAPGERVSVRNTGSGAELIGRVTEDGALLIEDGPIRRGHR